MAALGPYSRADALAKLDGRTREARLLGKVRKDLTAHVGGKPTVTQQALIERAAMLTLHLSLLDAKALQSGGEVTDHDSRQYLAWSNALTRLMKSLGTDKPTPPPPARTLADLIRQKPEVPA